MRKTENTIEALEQRLEELQAEIKEAERRLPAHSTKPTTMMLLLDLEDERDAIEARIKAIEKGFKGSRVQGFKVEDA